MDRRGSAFATAGHRTQLEMKELSMKLYGKKGDYLPPSFVSGLSSAVYPKLPEIKLRELRAIWEHWTVERQSIFMRKYDDIAMLLPIEVDEQLLKAIILFWDPSYCCFTFNQEDLTPTVEEYVAILRISPPNPDKVFWKKNRKVPFKNKLAQMMNIDASIIVSKIRLKGRNECAQRDFLEKYILENDSDDRVIDMFALLVYGTVIFP
ncbi:hypothetical protein CRYUN_Cryun28dG0005900 [Craigia yunnanensis]